MRTIVKWSWLALVAIIGCGGGGVGNNGSPTSVTRFVGNWGGAMSVQGGDDLVIYLTISASGAVTGDTYPVDATFPFGPVYTYSGMIQGSGSFTMSGTSPGLPNTTVNGSLVLTQGSPAETGTATAGAINSFLNGSGTLSSGSAPMPVTLSFQEQG